MKEINIARAVSERLGLPEKGVSATISLLDEGATVPFISRYRKEATGALTDIQVREIELTLKQVRELESRRESVIKQVAELGKLTPELENKLMHASTLTDLEDLYAPYKPKKRTRATIAREKGLEPLAKKIMSGYMPPACNEEELAGARDIIAEWASESVRLRQITRRTLRRSSQIVSTTVKGKEAELNNSPLAQYGTFRQGVSRMASHQYLALRRAEREGLVRIKYDLGEQEEDLLYKLSGSFMPNRSTPETAKQIETAVRDAAKRLLRPSVENEISAELKEEADKVAIEIFSSNLRELLLAPPLKNKRVLAIDPGYRTGCKVVALDAQGTLLAENVIYPTAPKNDFTGATAVIEKLIRAHKLEVIALGNGTASRETESFLKQSGLLDPKKIYVVSEDGASVYSASEIARKEFPDKDVTVRGAVSIGRRLIDPLAELVKIDPKSIGVGQYQHDVDQNGLKDALDYTVTACVNSVGVDVNTASEKLLSYVSGIGPTLASNIVSYRTQNGPFKTRAELKKVPRLGEKAYELCAGFLRVPGGTEPLDNTGIHPESYGIVRSIAKGMGVNITTLASNKPLLDMIDAHKLAMEGHGGEETIKDIVTELRKPGRDPRTDDETTIFTPTVSRFEDLSVGMRVNGKVNNITAFGAFIDLGIKENGLIHISKLSERRLSSVSQVLKLGQIVEAKVIDIDHDRKRISLSLI